jgi:hypothetical protein
MTVLANGSGMSLPYGPADLTPEPGRGIETKALSIGGKPADKTRSRAVGFCVGAPHEKAPPGGAGLSSGSLAPTVPLVSV